MAEHLLKELFKKHNRNSIFVDILLVNKSQKMVCAFDKDGREPPSRQEYNVIEERSLLRENMKLLRNGGRADYYINPNLNEYFNKDVDIPLGIHDKQDFIVGDDEDYSVNYNEIPWVYFLFPIVDSELEKVKMVVRYAYRDANEQNFDMMAKFTVQTVQYELMQSFSQFKQTIIF